MQYKIDKVKRSLMNMGDRVKKCNKHVIEISEGYQANIIGKKH